MANVVSVKDFLAAYRPAYDAVKADGKRKRGEKAYEDLFAVADRTDDMQEAQLIIEKEGLMLRLTTEDALDIHENTLAKLDPLDEITTVLTALNVEMYRNAKSVEDITYRSQFLDFETLEKTARGKAKMLLSSNLADLLLKYDKSKRAVREWTRDDIAQGGVSNMAGIRAAVKKLLEKLPEECGWEVKSDKELIDRIFEDQFFMIWLLAPQNTDEYGRTKKTMHPDALDAYRDLLEEIVSDKSLADILKAKQEHSMTYRFE